MIIIERRGGRSSWIRFGKEGINILFKGVESFRKEAGKNNTGLEWWENGRRYSLELRKNEGGWFLLYSVVDLDGRWHRLSFPEGNGLLNGWSMLEEALLAMGAMGTMENKGEKSKPIKTTAHGKAVSEEKGHSQLQSTGETMSNDKGNQDMIWMDISKFISKELLGSLKYGVVGGWKSKQAIDPPSTDLVAWAKRAWRLKGDVKFQKLSQKLFFLGFESVEEAEWVMENGSRIFRGEAMFLEWWSPTIGCEGRKEQESEVWIRVVGLPLHLWSEDILKDLGDRCGGFVVMDKATTHRKDLRWARILVKNSCYKKPSSVNVLAGARSYELQIWWEIQPKVVEVYPKIYRPKGFWTKPSEEDEGDSRVNGRMRDALGKRVHTAQELQWVESQNMGQGLSVSVGGMDQRRKCFGTPKVGPKFCCVSQNNLGIKKIKGGEMRGRERASKTGHFGLQSGIDEAHKLSPCREFCMGQSPKINRKQTGCPSVKKDADKQRVKCKERSDGEKINAEKHINVSTQRREDIEGDTKEQQDKSSKDMSRQKKEEDQKRGLGIEEEKMSKVEKGRQSGDIGRTLVISDRESLSGNSSSNTFPSAIVGVDGAADRFYAKEKSKGTDLPEDGCVEGGNDRGVNTQVGREVILDYGAPSMPKETSRRLGLEIEEDCGVRVARRVGTGAGGPTKGVGSRATSSERECRYLKLIQEQKALGAVQTARAICGSDAIFGSGLELGCIQGRLKGLAPVGLSHSPSYSNGLIPDGQTVTSPDSSWVKDKGENSGLIQGSTARPSISPECKPASSRDYNPGEEGNKIQCREEDVTREAPSQDDVCIYSNRYVDKFNDSSPSLHFSVFGRPLLPGDFSGRGGITRQEDLVSVRMAEKDSKGRGRDLAGVTLIFGEEYEEADRRTEEAQQDPSESEPYDRWESSCLIKFSEFLGFSTKVI